MKTFRIPAAAAVFLAACGDPSFAGTSRNGLPDGERVAVTAVAQREYPSSRMDRSARLAVRSAAAWDSVAPLVFHSPPPASTFDFASETVVVAAMGGRSSGGFGIAVYGAVVSGGELVVSVVETSPGRSCFVTTALTAPVAVARVARAGLPVRFVERKEVRDC